MIRRTILFDNQCGFALGENSRAPNPYVTWRFNEQDGQRNYFWGHYMNEPDMAERDLLNRAEDYQRRYHVQEVEDVYKRQSLYYGMNALSHNVIMADRKKLKSANGLYLGSTGSGKSFAAKREIINVFLAIPKDRIIIVDPMGEYAPLVRRLGGQVVEIAPGSPSHINPMDIRLDMDEDESPLSMKADFLLSLCELVVGGKDGLQPIEKTVIDRCVRLIYRDMALGIGDGKPPLLQDLYEELLKQPEPEARRVATALELSLIHI